MSFADLARRASKFAIDNSPAILTSIGVAGTITTAYLAAKATWQANDIIRLQEGTEYSNEEDPREPREVIKDRFNLTWRLYIPAVTTGAAAIVCIIGANKVGARRAAGIAAAMSITEKTLDEYRAKVVEKLGPRKEEAVRDEIMQDRVNATYLDGVQILNADNGELCWDHYSDRYFASSVEQIRAAENNLNFALIHDGYASLSEFYSFLGIPSMPYSESVGWNSDRKLTVRITTTMAAGTKPCLAIHFENDPLPDYGRFH